MLTAEETAWLDSYHARVREALAPLVDAPTRAWLIGDGADRARVSRLRAMHRSLPRSEFQ